jgi:hypothetical protein
MSSRRTLSGLSIALTMVAGTTLALSAPATADPLPALECPGVETTVYQPGLTLNPRDVSLHADATYVCGATSSTDGHVPNASCLDLALPHVTEKLHFALGGTSTINYQTGVAARVAEGVVVTLFGNVTHGPRQGGTAQKTILIASTGNLSADCLTEDGLESVSGPVNLVILGG